MTGGMERGSDTEAQTRNVELRRCWSNDAHGNSTCGWSRKDGGYGKIISRSLVQDLLRQARRIPRNIDDAVRVGAVDVWHMEGMVHSPVSGIEVCSKLSDSNSPGATLSRFS